MPAPAGLRRSHDIIITSNYELAFENFIGSGAAFRVLFSISRETFHTVEIKHGGKKKRSDRLRNLNVINDIEPRVTFSLKLFFYRTSFGPCGSCVDVND